MGDLWAFLLKEMKGSKVLRIVAKKTYYNGYKFRSRCEARWAVFFDDLGLRYEYEAEDFITPYGRYLPDFHLKDFDNCFCEVKYRGGFKIRDYKRILWLVQNKGMTFLLLDGNPDYISYVMKSPDYKGGVPFAFDCSPITQKLFVWPLSDDNDRQFDATTKAFFNHQSYGVMAARQAQFEHYPS